MSSSQQEPETSGTTNTNINEPEAPDTKNSDPSLDPAVLEELEDGLATQLDVSVPSGPEAPENTRRFTLIVTGTVPGVDLAEERDLVLKYVERALMGLNVTHGIGLIGAAYRSDPLNESDPTDTVQDAPDTILLTDQDGDSSSEESAPGPSDGSPSGEDSDSDSFSTWT